MVGLLSERLKKVSEEACAARGTPSPFTQPVVDHLDLTQPFDATGLFKAVLKINGLCRDSPRAPGFRFAAPGRRATFHFRPALSSCHGLTMASIPWRIAAARTEWIAGSSPAMTTESLPVSLERRMSTGTQDYVDDPRNDRILISVNGELMPRDKAVVSVFDSGFVLGDGVWEGLRLIDGGDRLPRTRISTGSTRAPRRSTWISACRARSCRATALRLPARQQDARRRAHPPDGDARREAHALPGSARHDRPGDRRHHPRIQAAEAGACSQDGITLFTVHVRRTGPAEQDQKLNSHSKLNCILACIQATKAGADEALMLDPPASSPPATRRISSSCGAARCGPRRRNTASAASRAATCCEVAREAGIPAFEKRFSLTDVYGADEAFVTGTFAGLVPVRSVDGRDDRRGGTRAEPVTAQLRALYRRSRGAR